MHTVIVGGGFAGVKTALELSTYHTGKITLISDESHFLHHATLYATATGKSLAESVIPLDEIFYDKPGVEVINDRITGLDPKKRTVTGTHASYHYDKLVLALGSVTTYFGITGVEQHSFGIKTLDEVRAFNRHIKDEVIKNKKLDKNYVIVGGGASGVELAGALHDYLEHLSNVHGVDHTKLRVTLVEAADRLLPRLSKTASRIVKKRLERIGVTVLTNHMVEALDGKEIIINGEKIPTETAIWTSGVANNPFFREHAELFDLAKNGRVEVDEYLRARANIYVLGDNNTVPFSGQAFPALDQAAYAAKHIARTLSGTELAPFRPSQPATGIPVGENWAYVEKWGMYAAGMTGHFIRRRMELAGYKRLLPARQAKAAWRAHDIAEIDV